MANCPLTLRITKGSKLTFAELDGNFISLANCINSLPQYDSFVTGGTYNTSTNSIDFTGNFDFVPFSTDLSYLANTDITVTGGTYDSSTGVVTFYNNSGGTFQVSGFLTGYTNYYTTGVTLNNTTLEFNRTDLSNAYSVDLSSLIFTGNTSGNCITDLYISNLYGCSPITIHDNLILESGVTISSSNGGGQIELDYALQPSNILISTDNGGVSESFINLQSTDLNLSSLNGDVRIQSLNSNSFRSGNLFSNRSQILMEPDFVKIGVVDPSAVFSNDYESVVVYNTRSSDQATSNANKWPVIVSSKNSTILNGVRNSVILGGSDITATTNNTVYVDNLNIKTIGGGTSVINLGLDVNGNVVTGVTSNSGIFGISNSGGAYTYYSTLSSAMSAATAGQTIEMFADVTETGAVSVILKNGVNINGNGHTYTLNNTGTDSCLSDNGVAVSVSILNLNLKRIGATTPSNTNTTCLLVFGASKIDFNGSKAYGSNSVSVIINNSSATVSNVYAYGDTGLNAAITVYIASGKMDNSVVYNNTNNAGYYTNAIVNIGTIVNCVAYTTSGGYSIYNQGEMIDCVGYSTAVTAAGGGIRNDGTAIDSTGFSSGGVGFYAYINTLNENCNGYSAGSLGFQINGFINCKVMNCNGFSSASYGIYAYNGYIINSTAWSTANYGLYNSNAGDGLSNISNCTVTSDSSAALFCNSNTNTVISNNTITSRYNNASGHAVVLGATAFAGPPNPDILNNTLIVANASANCIYTTIASTIKYSSNVFKNSATPINANITQGIVNTQDNQGNILI